MNRIRLGVVAIFGTISCGSAPPPKSADEPAVAESTANEPAPSSEASASPKSEAPAAENEKASDLPGAPAATSVGFDFHAWCYDHGVEANLAVDGCEPSGFGKPPNDAIWCARHEDSTDGVASYFQALYVVRAKKLLRLIEIPVAAGVIAEVGKAELDSDRVRVKLERQSGTDGKSVTFTEDAKRDCTQALEASKEQATMDPKLGQKLGTAVQKVCAARGRYAWNGTTLTKVSSKP